MTTTTWQNMQIRSTKTNHRSIITFVKYSVADDNTEILFETAKELQSFTLLDAKLCIS